MKIRFTTENFPSSMTVKEDSGLPWGCVVQPYAPLDNESKNQLHLSEIARCENCFAYINSYVTFSRKKWRCNICGERNDVTERYATSDNRMQLPELKENCLDFIVEDPNNPQTPEKNSHDSEQSSDTLSAQNTGGVYDPSDLSNVPIFIAVVELTGPSDFLSLVKSGLTAALEALPPCTLFGLITYSNRIGVFDLRSSIPHVQHLHIPFDPYTEPSLSLDEIFPLSYFLVRVDEFLSNITSGIESLSSIASSNVTSERGLGSTIKLLLSSLTSSYQSINARISVFMSGTPNYGMGELEIYHEPKSSTDLSPQTNFYREEAIVAARAGIGIDMYVVKGIRDTQGHTPEIGLRSLKFLTSFTGGNLVLYSSANNSSLPQDVYRHLSKSQALHGLLRIRTSKDFCVSESYGHFFPDENFENLYHLSLCDHYRSFAFDFELSSPNAFMDDYLQPCIQVAFAYTELPSGCVSSHLVRKLRVCTVRCGIGHNPTQLYKGADPDPILTLLTHKIIRASLDESRSEGKLLLQDWLLVFLKNYQKHFDKTSYGHRAIVEQNPNNSNAIGEFFDVSFSKFGNLKTLPRLVFALIKSKLLAMDATTDDCIYFQSICCGLDPQFLHRVIYPMMSSFGAPNNLSSQQLPLSRSSIESGGRIFLIDAFAVICVYYSESASELPFPPPKDSMIRKTLTSLKGDRPLTPDVLMIQCNTPQDMYFQMFLIEEETPTGGSYTQFLQYLLKQLDTF